MAVGNRQLAPLQPIDGIRIGIAEAGIKYPNRRDLVLFELARETVTAAVFTRNAFCAAPVTLCREHLTSATPRYLLINTGNANAGTGIAGMRDARNCCEAVAEATGCAPHEVLPFSTGVIGEALPVAKIVDGLPDALAAQDADAWEQAAYGIMTTDTVPKGDSRQIEIAGKTVTITGIAKGSGMIRPDMATMLAYIATDAKLEQALLQQTLEQAVASSFNRITVDGDTSTNDSCVLMATGRSGVVIEPASEAFTLFTQAVTELCEQLAQDMIRDGEGATKLISVKVTEGRDEAECAQVAFTVAHSPLIKTAFFASDPNWGRILAAVGRSGLAGLDIDAITLYLDDLCIVRNGGRDADYSEEKGQAVMEREEITVGINLGRGSATATVWTCDFSYDYVRINAEYRT
jgi:glutamate N-acetyltransferase/amino-acid N-acetyltransferase